MIYKHTGEPNLDTVAPVTRGPGGPPERPHGVADERLRRGNRQPLPQQVAEARHTSGDVHWIQGEDGDPAAGVLVA